VGLGCGEELARFEGFERVMGRFMALGDHGVAEAVIAALAAKGELADDGQKKGGGGGREGRASGA